MTSNISSSILTKKQSDLLKLISNTGFYVENYNPNYIISKYTLNRCIDKHLIERGQNSLIFSKVLKTYYLTDKGKELVKSRFFIHPYRAKTTQIEHDYILNKIYISLSEQERDTWITETELNIKYPTYSVSDGMYRDINNQLVGVEVITKNYTKDYIDSKMRFLEKFSDKQILIDIDKLE